MHNFTSKHTNATSYTLQTSILHLLTQGIMRRYLFAMALCLSEQVSVGPRLSHMALNLSVFIQFLVYNYRPFYIIHANFQNINN